MIEISHLQARRLIRRNLDGHLPEEQWHNLQAHLETCAECRVYLSRMGLVEKNIRRALKTRWSVVPGPNSGLAQQALKIRQARAMIRRRVILVGGAAVVLFLFTLGGGFQRLFHAALPAAPLSATEVPRPTATPAPTLASGEFRGVVAFDSTTSDGGTGIFLLNPGSGNGGANNEVAPELLLDSTAFNNGGARYGSQDSDPAWSPDGEWIAFLSARGTGKKEVYASNVAGSRVVQLTDEPDISWEGPLSWSADGQWIALTGIRTKQGNQRWVYRVSLDGSGPIAVDGSRNGYDPEYAPNGDRLAFEYSDGTQEGIVVRHLDGTENASAIWTENPQAVPPAPGSVMDWSQDGTALAYIAGPPPSTTQGSDSAGQGERIMASRDLNYSVSLFYDPLHNLQAASSPWPGAYRGVTWTPLGGLVYLENVDDSRAHDAPGQTTTGCWTLQVRGIGFRRNDGIPSPQPNPFSTLTGQDQTSLPNSRNQAQDGYVGITVAISGLCVESGIDRSSWTPDGQWLVVLGRTPEEMVKGAARGLYAVGLPRSSDRASGLSGNSRIVRLATMEGAAGMPRVRPSLRRNARPLNINPQPVQKRTVLSGSDLRMASGNIYFSNNQGTGSVIASMSPDGTGGKTLFGSDGANRCPSPSPDGSWIAFVSDWDYRGTAQQSTSELSNPGDPAHPGVTATGGNGIFLMDPNGANISTINSQEWIPETGSQQGANFSPAIYGCPVWSQDGNYLAAAVETPMQWYLGVFAVKNGKPDPGIPPRFARIGEPLKGIDPRWAVNGTRILLAQIILSREPASILAIDVPTDPSGDLTVRPLYRERDGSNIAGLGVSPDGQRVVVIELRDGASGKKATLRSIDARWGTRIDQVELGDNLADQVIQSNLVQWNQSGNVGIVLQNMPDQQYKAVIVRYDSRDNRVEGHIMVEDVVYDAAWSPDGNWVIYSTESGLWVASVNAAESGRASPVWISPEPVFDLAWK